MADKKGETVRAEASQFDENGERISYALVEWYGMDNAEANAMSMQLIGGVTQIADGWREAKKAGKKLAGNP